MNATVILVVFVIGFAAGLRAFTAPAIVAWCAYLGCINLGGTSFAFMESPIIVGVFSLMAIGEYVWDLLPNTPKRTAAPGLIGRVLAGSLSAACLLAATNSSLALSVLGGIAAIVGAFVGLQIRARLVRSLAVNDAWIAIPEDLVSIGLSLSAVCLITT